MLFGSKNKKKPAGFGLERRQAVSDKEGSIRSCTQQAVSKSGRRKL